MSFSKTRTGRSNRLLLPGVALFFSGLLIAFFWVYFEAETPSARFTDLPEFIGENATIAFAAEDLKSGLSSISLTAVQGDNEISLFHKTNSRQGLTLPLGPKEIQQKILFSPVGHGFEEGDLELRLEVRDFSLRGWFTGNAARVVKKVAIDITAPKIRLVHGERYISSGGTGIAIYQISEPLISHGVTVNNFFFRGYPIGDGREEMQIAFFAIPYHSKGLEGQMVVATDKAGNTTRLPFSTVFKKKRYKQDSINVSDGFLNRKIPEFEQYVTVLAGKNLEKYLYANRIIRKENNEKIAELCKSPHPKRLWEGPFLRMAGSSRAGFADHRTYYYNGKAIDRQVHLGMDIASTRRAKIKAANKGKVIFADYLGIYGKMVLLDHGQGVFSLYSHLSDIKAAPGDFLERGAVLGLTGTSGMAGGDHLHFSMLVHGIFVTPKEWWDRNWIEATIEEPLIDSRF